MPTPTPTAASPKPAASAIAAPTSPAPVIPAWAQSIRQKYLAGEASLFILHGNVFDRFWIDGKAWSLQDFLANILFANNKELVLELSLGRGLAPLLPDKAGTPPFKRVMRDDAGIAGLLDIVETFVGIGRSLALIVPYASTLLPNGDTQFLSADERVTMTTLHRWSLDETVARHDAIVVLITESLGEINQAMVTNPRVAAIEVPMPDVDERAVAIRNSAPHMPEDHVRMLAQHMAGLRALHAASIVANQVPTSLTEQQRYDLIFSMIQGQKDDVERSKRMANITAGMSAEEIGNMVNPAHPIAPAGASPEDEMLTIVRKRKREIIERECGGLIEFIDAARGLDSVGGCDYIKNELKEIAEVFKGGDRTLSPMGMLAVGPMGAGKTYVIRAFVKDAGLVAVALKNFRSKWQGATESNLERVLSTVKAMGPIAVIIDEGDRTFGGGGGDDADGGTNSRVMARLKEFMSDTDNRGSVLFILMTNRPDRIEVDLKRPGRLDRKIPFFYAQTPGEQADILRTVFRRYGADTAIDWSDTDRFLASLAGYSNADLEAVALLSLDLARRAGKPVDNAIFQQAMGDFIPPREPQMIEFMELLAVQETSRRSLLPERFRNISTEQIQDRLAVLAPRYR